jgi:hypothetical protein
MSDKPSKVGRPPILPRMSALEEQVAALAANLKAIEAQLARAPDQVIPSVRQTQAYEPLFNHWPGTQR